MQATDPTNDQPTARRHRRPPVDPSLLRKCDAALALGVTRPRISQLIKAGQLQPRPDGLVTAEEVERCRRCEPIAWQPDYMKTNYLKSRL